MNTKSKTDIAWIKSFKNKKANDAIARIPKDFRRQARELKAKTPVASPVKRYVWTPNLGA